MLSENSSVSVKLLLGFLGLAIPLIATCLAFLWKISLSAQIINTELSGISRRLDMAWTVQDASAFERELRYRNPSLTVPEAQKIFSESRTRYNSGN